MTARGHAQVSPSYEGILSQRLIDLVWVGGDPRAERLRATDHVTELPRANYYTSSLTATFSAGNCRDVTRSPDPNRRCAR